VQNAIKHAEARHIRIAMSRAPMTIYLKISDDGKGIRETPPSKGMGLQIMRYRARMIGATLEIKSAAGKGTEISLTMRTDTIKANHSANSIPSGEWIAEHI
jgi:signal transduction histidine kinase